MIATHHIQKITFDKHQIKLIIDGKEITLSLEKVSSKLFRATHIERSFYKISPSGYGIHWPLIDEDLSVSGILQASEH